LAAQAFLKSIFRKKYYKTKEGGRKREIDSFFISYEKKRESERDRKRERERERDREMQNFTINN